MLHDISVAVHPGTPEWPGDTPYSCRWTWAMSGGASVNVSATTASPHVGTHADAPLHVRDGWPAVDELPLDAFHGDALVIDVANAEEEITVDALEQHLGIAGVGAGSALTRLLLRTGRTIADGAFPESWPVLATASIDALLGRGLRLLGVDAPSVDGRHSTTLLVHHRLFARDAYVLENLDLREVRPGRYELLAFPQKLVGLDAAPVRAVLRAPRTALD